MRQTIREIVTQIKPVDTLEATHQADVLAWIDSKAPLFRISKPDNPPKHLVSYFVLYDQQAGKLLLIDHIKAQAWLPTGGHVEMDEHPRKAVEREALEELNHVARFETPFGNKPLFITVTQTKGTGSHTDVSLWYVICGDSTKDLLFDKGEMNSYRWLTPEEILTTDIAELDPHMHRFTQKLIKGTHT